MKTQSRIRYVLPFVMTLILFAVGSHGALAQPTGRYDLLTFPTCTTWRVDSTAGVNQPGPSNYVETMTDGRGNVVFSRSQAGGIGFFTFWGSGTFTTQPVVNPIHEFVVMDGVIITDTFANDPCLPLSAVAIPASSTPQLVAMAVLLSLFGILAIRRKWRQGRDTRR